MCALCRSQDFQAASRPIRLTAPALAEYSVYLPFLVIAWASFLEVRRIREARSHGASWMKCFDGGGPIVALLILMNLLFTLKGLVRVSAIHMVQSLVLSIMIAAVMAGRLNWRQRNDQIALLPALAVTAMLLVVPAFKGLKAFGAGISSVITSENSLVSRCISPPLPRLRCVSIDGDALAAAQYVLSNTRDGDAIYAGAGRHDRLFVNAIATYFAAERRPATKWHELHPGVQTTAAAQSAMVAEFKVNAPKLVLLDERWDKIEEPNASRISSGVTLLDDYIRANFTETKRFGSIRVLAPRRAVSDVGILAPVRGARLTAR